MILRVAACLCLATALAGCGGSDGTSSDDYAARNVELLEALPLPQAASQARSETENYAPTAYATSARFRAPRGTTARALAAFYFSRLRPSWRLVERSVYPQPDGNSIIILGFRRGEEGVWLNTADLYATGQFELIVDHRAWQQRGAG